MPFSAEANAICPGDIVEQYGRSETLRVARENPKVQLDGGVTRAILKPKTSGGAGNRIPMRAQQSPVIRRKTRSQGATTMDREFPSICHSRTPSAPRVTVPTSQDRNLSRESQVLVLTGTRAM